MSTSVPSGETPKKVEFEDVNKFKENWEPKSLFSDFNVRAILAEQPDIITQMGETDRMRRKLSKSMGDEGDDWLIVENPFTGMDELYLKDSGILLIWKLNDHAGFVELFSRVEQHQEEIDGIQKD